jgi:hypothetical protein
MPMPKMARLRVNSGRSASSAPAASPSARCDLQTQRDGPGHLAALQRLAAACCQQQAAAQKCTAALPVVCLCSLLSLAAALIARVEQRSASGKVGLPCEAVVRPVEVAVFVDHTLQRGAAVVPQLRPQLLRRLRLQHDTEHEMTYNI